MWSLKEIHLHFEDHSQQVLRNIGSTSQYTPQMKWASETAVIVQGYKHELQEVAKCLYNNVQIKMNGNCWLNNRPVKFCWCNWVTPISFGSWVAISNCKQWHNQRARGGGCLPNHPPRPSLRKCLIFRETYGGRGLCLHELTCSSIANL